MKISLEDVRYELELVEFRILLSFFTVYLKIPNFDSKVYDDNNNNSMGGSPWTQTIQLNVCQWYKTIVRPILIRSSYNTSHTLLLTSADEAVIKIITYRISLGEKVAQCKYYDNKNTLRNILNNTNNQEKEILNFLTYEDIEKKVLYRIHERADQLVEFFKKNSQGLSSDLTGSIIAEWFESFIIPATKRVQVEWILKTLKETKHSENEEITFA